MGGGSFAVCETVATPTLASSPSRSGYEQSLAEARGYSAEKSWSRARGAFASALKLAPSDRDHAFCEAWLTDASWRAEDVSAGWQVQGLRTKNYETVFDSLLAPYGKGGQPYDEVWATLIESRMELRLAGHHSSRAFDDALALVDFASQQAPGEAAEKNYVAVLKRVTERFPIKELHHDMAPLLPHWSQAKRATSIADDRAWCALQVAQIRTEANSLSYKQPVL